MSDDREHVPIGAIGVRRRCGMGHGRGTRCGRRCARAWRRYRATRRAPARRQSLQPRVASVLARRSGRGALRLSIAVYRRWRTRGSSRAIDTRFHDASINQWRNNGEIMAKWCNAGRAMPRRSAQSQTDKRTSAATTPEPLVELGPAPASGLFTLTPCICDARAIQEVTEKSGPVIESAKIPAKSLRAPQQPFDLVALFCRLPERRSMAAIAQDWVARPGRLPSPALERQCLNTRRGFCVHLARQ